MVVNRRFFELFLEVKELKNAGTLTDLSVLIIAIAIS